MRFAAEMLIPLLLVPHCSASLQGETAVHFRVGMFGIVVTGHWHLWLRIL
jgi:hypothetical protein